MKPSSADKALPTAGRRHKHIFMSSLRPTAPLPFDALLAALEAAGEVTRLRLLGLLCEAELTVSELVGILGQSQPRISRHLKLSGRRWARRAPSRGRLGVLPPRRARRRPGARPHRPRRRRRSDARLRPRAAGAGARGAAQAGGRLFRGAGRRMGPHPRHARARRAGRGGDPRPRRRRPGAGAARSRRRNRPHAGTARAPRAARAVGVDLSPAMLNLARARIEEKGLRNVQLRQGDVYAPPVERGAYDLVVIHQVLHFLDDPGRALAEAARLLRPGGRLHRRRFRRARGRIACASISPIAVSASAARRSPALMQEAGLDVLETRRIAPGAGETGKLTVVIWLARDPRVISDDLQKRLAGVRLMLHDARPPQPLRLARHRLVRVLPAEVRGDGGDAVGGDQAAGAARPRISSPSPTAPAARRARAPTRRWRRSPRETYLRPAAHLTCVGAAKGEVDDVIRAYWDAGVRHIVALRGDSAGRGRCALCAASRRLSAHRGSGRGDQADRRFRGLRRRLSGKTSAEPDAVPRHRRAEAQGRRRGRSRHQSILFR